MRNIFHNFYRTNIGSKVKLETLSSTSNERNIMQLPISDAHKGNDIPTLNASEIPHAVRHGAIHGALGTLNVGESMILIAPHNPVPLSRRLRHARSPSTLPTSRKNHKISTSSSPAPPSAGVS